MDLLLEDSDTHKRYEVEIQLGSTDETHLVRTLEYWDIERKRYPQYDHCAVIIAEDITSRFLNIISLFNGFIPLIAIQMSAIKIQDGTGLIFTKVLDELNLGLEDNDGVANLEVKREYWLNRGTKQTVALVDELHKIVQTIAPEYKLKYNRYYIGLEKGGVVNNFISFRPKKQFVKIGSRMDEDAALTAEMDSAGLESEYIPKWSLYTIRLYEGDLDKNKALIEKFINRAYESNKD